MCMPPSEEDHYCQCRLRPQIYTTLLRMFWQRLHLLSSQVKLTKHQNKKTLLIRSITAMIMTMSKLASLLVAMTALVLFPGGCSASSFSPASGKHSLLSQSVRRHLQTAGSLATCTDLENDMEGIQGTNGEIIYECACAANDVNGYTLSCTNNCEYCTSDDAVCVMVTETIIIDGNSNIQEKLTEQTYTRGGNNGEVLTYNVTNCDANFICDFCEIDVGDTRCEVCQLNICSNGKQQPIFLCNAVETGGAIDLCNFSQDIPSTSVFDILDEDNLRCFINGMLVTPDTPAPTPSPSASAPPTFITDTRCPLRIGTNRCEDLVQSTGITPVEGCDCYNFCGGEYVGCCNLQETCNIECDIDDYPPTAGCRLDGVVDVGPELNCTGVLSDGTVLTFFEGESFGPLVETACGSTDDFPCFCSPFTEADQLRCPYCPFVQSDGTFICARDNEFVIFEDEQGVTQNCTCNYLGNKQAATGCIPIIDPPQVCALQRNTDQCAAVTEFVNPIPDCDCYNFCGGEFNSCCKYGEPCSTEACSDSISPNEIVAGCEIDPNRPPVTTPPVPPAAAPTDPPGVCLITAQNQEMCPDLVTNQGPVEGCDCYNYCNGELTGCCAYNDNTCTASCSGTPPLVLVTGCELSDEPTSPSDAPSPPRQSSDPSLSPSLEPTISNNSPSTVPPVSSPSNEMISGPSPIPSPVPSPAPQSPMPSPAPIPMPSIVSSPLPSPAPQSGEMPSTLSSESPSATPSLTPTRPPTEQVPTAVTVSPSTMMTTTLNSVNPTTADGSDDVAAATSSATSTTVFFTTSSSRFLFSILMSIALLDAILQNVVL